MGVSFSVNAQKDERKQLEEKRKALQKEITEINNLQTSNTRKKESALNTAEDLNRRIQATEQLIQTNNQEANLLTEEITTNENKISVLENELEELKEDYARMVSKSYKSRSKQSRIMFLFSSENFLQAYKRLQYMKQYTGYREEQGKKIKTQTEELAALNDTLEDQREDKKELLVQNQSEQEKLKTDKQEQDVLIAEINKKGSKYQSQIKERQQEIATIDNEIKRLVREAIAAENKKKGSDSSSEFDLTPEAKKLAASFEANKGKLPWPLKSGSIAVGFGTQQSSLAKNVTIESHGIRIATNEHEPVYAIFEGKVLGLESIPGANKLVYVQHGNYISIYRNLKGLDVKKGQELQTGEKIGEVGKSTVTRRPTLYFSIYNNNKALDPTNWILER